MEQNRKSNLGKDDDQRAPATGITNQRAEHQTQSNMLKKNGGEAIDDLEDSASDFDELEFADVTQNEN